eukprot:100869_1
MSTSFEEKYLSDDGKASLLIKKNPRSEESGQFVPYAYGTAGFRCPAGLLPSVVVRVGMLTALRSLSAGGQAVGVMITASHNKESDNGIKIVDPSGHMLHTEWERLGSELANADEKSAASLLRSMFAKHVPAATQACTPEVYVGRDTRPSSPGLSRLLVEGARALGARVRDFEIVTTPQLHYMVRLHNIHSVKEPSLEDYAQNVSAAFKECLKESCEALCIPMPESLPSVCVDCACGVGDPGIRRLTSLIRDTLKIELFNKVGEASVNDGCGAEHVQKLRAFPRATPPPSDGDPTRFASFDGDADRLVYFFRGADGGLRLLDGDKCAALATNFIRKLLVEAKLEEEFQITCVQTAYANGSSTAFLSSVLGAHPTCAATGVKNMEPVAQCADVGVYFEANGHGSVLFSEGFRKAVAERRESAAARALAILPSLVNQAVGDAISNLLLMEVALTAFGWTLQDWSDMYEDLPSRMTKVSVPDRSLIKTTPDERVTTAPVGLQSEIERAASGVDCGRSFVRPSGTEDIVRVYAEASTQDQADSLATKVEDLVRTFLC